MNREPVKILRNIIISEMELDNDKVLIYNQAYRLPDDDDMFVILSPLSNKPFGNRLTYEVTDAGLNEIIKYNQQETISIDCFSKTNEARIRKEEILLALGSTYSQQMQEEYSFNIGRIPIGFNDVSEVEGSRRLNRYNITINILTWYTKTKSIAYYDDYGKLIYNTNLFINK